MSLASHMWVGVSTDPPAPVHYNPMALQPFDALKVVMEQVLLLNYVGRTAPTSDVIWQAFCEKVQADVNAMPLNLPGGCDPALTTLYQNGVLTIKDWMSFWYDNKNRWKHMAPQDIFAIFYTPDQRRYINGEYTSTMTEHFLTLILAMCYGYYDVEKYPARQLLEAALHIPHIYTTYNNNPGMTSAQNQKYNEQMVLKLEPISVAAVDLEFKDYDSYPLEWLTNFNLSQYNVDELVGIIANFSIDRSRYAMTNPGTPTVPDICYDLVSGSHITPIVGAGNNDPNTPDDLAERDLRFVKEMLAKEYIRPSEDTGLFGELLSRLGASSDLYNYFIRPVELISAAEAYAFRSSSFASFMEERLIPGMAAADEDEDTGDDDADDEDEGTDDQAGEDDTDTPQDTGEDGDDTDVGDMDTGLDSAEEKEEPAEDKKPHIDPDRMLLELANPNQSMSDYIFREMVARRITEILKNPPQNAMPNDLLMLKRWRSRWLYLVNVPCLRDFLTRLSLRLSDV